MLQHIGLTGGEDKRDIAYVPSRFLLVDEESSLDVYDKLC